MFKIRHKQKKPRKFPQVHFSSFQVPSVLSAPFDSPEGALQLVKNTIAGLTDLNVTNPYFNHHQDMVYLSSCGHGMPIVFDTGASISVSPLCDDFIGDLQPAPYSTLKGLKGTIKVIG
jgi:hypothetical protein